MDTSKTNSNRQAFGWPSSSKTKKVMITGGNGEEYEFRSENDEGVETSGGFFPWSRVAAFRCWSPSHQMWFTVPV